MRGRCETQKMCRSDRLRAGLRRGWTQSIRVDREKVNTWTFLERSEDQRKPREEEDSALGH